MEEVTLVCKNPWCKAHFKFVVNDLEDEIPQVCPKCQSFDNELSGGVSWSDRKYDDPKDYSPHPTKINIRRSIDKRW